jgi:hypothetical protein
MIVSLLLWVFWTFFPQAAPFKAVFKNQLVYPEWIFCILIFAAAAIFGKTPAGKLVPQDDE